MNVGAPGSGKRGTADSILPLLPIVISFTALVFSIYNSYLINFSVRRGMYVEQLGVVVPVPKPGDTLRAVLNTDAHFILTNSGNRPLAIENMYLTVFQPGSEQSLRGDRDEFLTSRDDFNGSDCQGALTTVIPFVINSQLLQASNITVNDITFSSALDPKAAQIDITKVNMASIEPQFVFCISLRIADIEGKRYAANIPQWTAKFKRDRGNLISLEDAKTPFKWSQKRYQELFSAKLVRELHEQN